jgi:glycosyltransferase involved in cell wall biosynthesis
MFESFFGAIKYDACFIQRELVPNPNMFVEMFVLGCFNKVFFDFDDSIFLFPSWAKAQKGTLENKEMERKIHYLISRSSEVIVSNAFLQERVATLNPHVSVIPTPVDTTYYKPAKKNRDGRPVLIGWTGTSGNLYYLRGIMDVFEKLWEEGENFKLRIICNIPEQDYGIDMTKGYTEFREWKLRDEIKNFNEIDIGIMPLTDDDWTRGKAGFKILQFMASGIPIVASPVGVNSEIVIHEENGFLARTEEEWVRFLKGLIEDGDLRDRMGENGRERIEKHYSLKVIAPRFLGILQRQLRPS